MNDGPYKPPTSNPLDNAPPGTHIKPVNPPQGHDRTRISEYGNRPGMPVEDWYSYGWFKLHQSSKKISADELDKVREAWSEVARDLESSFKWLQSALGGIIESDWVGEGAKAAHDATAMYIQENIGLQSAIDAMKSNYTNLQRSLADTKEHLPTVGEAERYIRDGVRAAFPALQEVAAGVDIDENGAVDVRVHTNADPEEVEQVKKSLINDVDNVAVRVMHNNYDPGIRSVRGSLPNFFGPNKKANDKPDRPDGPASTNSSGNGGGGQNSGATPTGSLGKPNVNKPNIKPTNLKNNNTPSIDGLKNALQGLSSTGTGLGGQASKLGDLGKNLVGKQKVSPHLLNKNNNKKNLAKTGAGGKGGGKGGGGAGKGGAGGAKPTGAALRDSLSNALRTASLGDRSLGSMSRATTSGPMGGAPMGGAGARGAGGDGKVHKANKFLQTTANGKALLGTPVASVSSVLSALPGGVKIPDATSPAVENK